MSIFKVKHWWSNEKQDVESGIQNSTCLKVDRFNCHSDSDCVVVGDGPLLKIYKPTAEETASHVLLESQFNDVILQVETGKFVAGSEDRQILVLHPQGYAVYQLHKKEGYTDAGDQNLLKPVIKHSFTRRAQSVTCGPFSNIKTRDFICIQALDGTLSFFDQETFLFMYISNDAIIPGPVCYIASSDSFVICKSTWVLEIHSYLQLREFSELHVRQNKKNVPQWIYNSGEEITSVQVIQTSNNFSSIVALGEKHLCCFQDNGLMKYMIKFDFMPICFCAYLIGWYYEPTARLIVMVASDESKLYVYENTTLLWSCDLLHQAISISRCFLKNLPGGLVTLSTDGVVSVCYLGTEPDLNGNAASMMNEAIDPDEVQTQLKTVEDSLNKIMNGKEDLDNQFSVIDQIMKIKADVGKPVQNLFQRFTEETNEELSLLRCPVVVIITCKDPKQIQSVQITYECYPPFASSEPTVCLENINGTEIIETQVFLSNETDIPETRVRILFTIIDCNYKINIQTREVYLPLSLYCVTTKDVAETEHVLQIQINQPGLSFTEIFTDFTKEELFKNGNSDTVSFTYRSTKKIVTLKADDNIYSVQTNDISDINAVLDHFLMKLQENCTRNSLKDFKISLKFDQTFSKQVIHKFLKSIETHARERIKLKALEEELNVLQRQFTLVQKRLLVQYGSLPPGDCDPLEFLMKDTHARLIKTVQELINSRETVCRAGNTLTTVGHLLILIFKHTVSDGFKVNLIQEMLTLSSLYEDYQDWEESVTQALAYILNKVLQKSEKDKEKLATVTEQGILSNVNLKRFLKQIRIVLEKMFSEARGDDSEIPKTENRVTRIEEFVEVI